MTVQSLIVLFLAVLNPSNAAAFLSSPSLSTKTRRHHNLHFELKSLSESEKERLRKTGGGLPPTSPGNNILFDPDLEGKLQGTGSVKLRIKQGSAFHAPPESSSSPYSSTTITPPPTTGHQLQDAQNWLEDIGLPLNFAKPSSPATATILGSGRIISPTAPGDIRHVLLQLPSGMHYVEGQSISIIPPGTDPKTNGRPHKPRLYSIASTRYGDLLDGTTASFCIRRAEFIDPTTNLPDPTKQGVCSNFLCDAPAGTTLQIAGPVGKTMLLPDDFSRDIIMIATGTGIAPFRGFLHRLFMERTIPGHLFTGLAWLVLGVPTTGGLLYQDEFAAMQQTALPSTLRIDYAISREMKTPTGDKLYVQHVIAQNAQEFLDRVQAGAHVYFCGLKGMMPPILDTLESVAGKEEWSNIMKVLKEENRWHVEVY